MSNPDERKIESGWSETRKNLVAFGTACGLVVAAIGGVYTVTYLGIGSQVLGLGIIACITGLITADIRDGLDATLPVQRRRPAQSRPAAQ